MARQQHLSDLPTLLWTSREAAQALAISERKLWTMTQDGGIPCVRIGRAVRYDPADLRKWIDEQKAKTPSQPTAPSVLE